PYIGAAASHESIYTIEFFKKLYDKLNTNGLLAVNVRDQVMLHKALSYVWRMVSENPGDKITNFRNNIRVLQIDKNSSYKDTYNYLVLVSKQRFTAEELKALNRLIDSAPIMKVIYDANNNIPPYRFFKQLNRITVSDATLHLTRASSWKYKKLINLEPSSIIKPNYFHLAVGLHPFVAGLSALFFIVSLYGLLFSHQKMRTLNKVEKQSSPVISILLFHSLLSVVAFILLLYATAIFSSASLGYSYFSISFLIVLALAAFVFPYAYTRAGKIISKGINEIWLFLVILLLGVFVLLGMEQDIEVLLGVSTKILIFALVVMFSFCSGLVHYQSTSYTQKFHPSVWFWIWYMSSVGVVIGVIISQYMLIEFNLGIIVQAAMGMFLFSALIIWWCRSASRMS
ncbi:MAG: hypothetical protein OQK32_07340, partial [Gammaproteobacteria bacterium]|nr:hypothetical protein [Gammaproteobacteria bacterium]